MTFDPIWIVIPGQITPWRRAQRRQMKTGIHVTFTHPDVEAYHAVVRMAAAKAMDGRPPFDEALELSILAVFAVPGSWSGKKTKLALEGMVHKTGRPDTENCIKGAQDAMQSIVYKDDAQIVCYRDCMKVYGARPRMEILITPARRLSDEPLYRPVKDTGYTRQRFPATIL